MKRRMNARRWTAWIAIGLVPVVLVSTLLLLEREFRQEQRLREAVEQSYRTRADLLTTLSVLQDLETGQRGYVVTGNAMFLDPYRAAKRKLEPEVLKLSRNLYDGAQPGPEFDELLGLIRQKVAFVERTVALRTQGRFADAELLINEGLGKRVMDRIRARLEAYDALERERLTTSLAEADASRRDTQRIAFLLQGTLALLLLLAALVTKRSLAAQSSLAARQQAIFNAATDGMIVHDRHGIIETVNPSAAEMHGHVPADLVGQFVGKLSAEPVTDDIFKAFLKRSVSANDGTGAFQLATAKRKNGTTFPVEVVTSPVQMDEGQRFLAIIRDVTERRRVEQMKNEFVSTVSHELRTPLTSIAGSLGLLAGGAAGALPERAAKLIKIAHGNSERLVRLINDILDIEKIESGKMTFDIRPTPLRHLLEQAIQSNQAYAAEFGVHTKLDDHGAEGATVLADPDRLMQVVINLLSNAAKFSPAGGAVTVAVRRAGKSYRIAVRDQGTGIPEAFKERIFSKFAQADSSDTRAKGGTGLGLSIVKEIVARHNGTVTFTSEPDEGTEFVVEIPAAEPGEARRQAASLVLLCEADDAGARRAKETLERAGFPCDIATSTDELRALTDARDYAVLILDLPLPGAEMVGLIRDLRRTKRYSTTPILVVSTESERGEISQAVDVADWIDKPVELGRLAEGVRAALAGVSGRPRILHVEDDLDVLKVVATAFDGRAQITPVVDLGEARDALKAQDFDLVILDLALPSGSGVDLLPDMRNSIGQPIPVVIFSAFESGPDLARQVEATLTKSKASLNNLVDTVEMLVERSARSRRLEKAL